MCFPTVSVLTSPWWCVRSVACLVRPSAYAVLKTRLTGCLFVRALGPSSPSLTEFVCLFACLLVPFFIRPSLVLFCSGWAPRTSLVLHSNWSCLGQLWAVRVKWDFFWEVSTGRLQSSLLLLFFLFFFFLFLSLSWFLVVVVQGRPDRSV